MPMFLEPSSLVGPSFGTISDGSEVKDVEHSCFRVAGSRKCSAHLIHSERRSLRLSSKFLAVGIGSGMEKSLNPLGRGEFIGGGDLLYQIIVARKTLEGDPAIWGNSTLNQTCARYFERTLPHDSRQCLNRPMRIQSCKVLEFDHSSFTRDALAAALASVVIVWVGK
jgi:hypothetical protein